MELHIPPGELIPSLASREQQQKNPHHLNAKCLCKHDKRQVQKDQVNKPKMERKRVIGFKRAVMQECREKEIGKRNQRR